MQGSGRDCCSGLTLLLLTAPIACPIRTSAGPDPSAVFAAIPVPGADHFSIVHELRDADGILTRQLALLID